MSARTAVSVPHRVARWSVGTGASFAGFRSRYEAAVNTDRMTRLRADHADWDAVLEAAAENAPHGFMRFWSTDVGATMQLAGSRGDCAAYLMGSIDQPSTRFATFGSPEIAAAGRELDRKVIHLLRVLDVPVSGALFSDGADR